MFIEKYVLIGVICLIAGYCIRGVQSAIAKRLFERKMTVEREKLKQSAIESGFFEARTLHPEKKSNINN